MQVNEHRLAHIASGASGARDLARSNPIVEEALTELGRGSAAPEAARRAGTQLAYALALDEPGAPRVRLGVGARAVHEAAALPSSSVRQRLARMLCGDAAMAVLCGALTGAGDERERDAVERALYLVATMVRAEEEVDALEQGVLEGAVP